MRTLLIQEFGTAPAERFAEACHAVTGGNAFLLRELIQQLRADGIGPDEEAAAQVAALGPRSVARAVALRVARLGPAAGELARAAAVLGRRGAAAARCGAGRVGLADAAAAADGLAGIGVFEPGTPLRFVHPIVRAAVHDDIPGPAGACVTPRRRGCWPPRARTLTRCARACWCRAGRIGRGGGALQAAAARAVGRGAPESAAAYLRRAMARRPM